ncbi:MAG: hypothetical protein R2726_10860 [Acidimicrobiales bacterium]
MSTLGNLAVVSPLLLVAAAGLWLANRLATRRPVPALARRAAAPIDHATVLARYGVHPAGAARTTSATVTRLDAERPVREDVAA